MALNLLKAQTRFTNLILLAILCFGLSGCGSLKTRSQISQARESTSRQAERAPSQNLHVTSTPIDVSEIESSNGAEASVHAAASTEAEEENKPAKAEVDVRMKIPVELNADVERWIEYFTKKDRERFQRFLNRGQKYRDVVESVLEENDLPAELYYLAMIESGYQTHAKSHAKAVGVWQFIAGTGHRYGLRIDKYVDERRDPIRSSEAAAKYLRDLYNVFGSWHLAMAAYNAGEIRILRAVMKARTRNFWELVELRALPSETANYVPKFLAVVLIGQNPEKYGFKVQESASPYPDLEAVEIPGSISLEVLAKKSGVSLPMLKMVNPHLLSASTPPNASGYEIWAPVGSSRKIASIRSDLTRIAKQKRAIAAISDKPSDRTYHIVRSGENLSLIARKYKMSAGHLKRINNLKSSRLFVGAKLRIQPSTYRASATVKYKVRRGDNLTVIAKRFNTTPQKIKAANRMTRNRIFVGQILKIDGKNPL